MRNTRPRSLAEIERDLADVIRAQAEDSPQRAALLGALAQSLAVRSLRPAFPSGQPVVAAALRAVGQVIDGERPPRALAA